MLGTFLSISAQNFYISPSLGYGFSLRGNGLYVVSGTSIESQGLNMGGGANAGLAGGIQLSKQLALELRLNYQNNLAASYDATFGIFQSTPGPTEEMTFRAQSLRAASLLHFRLDQDLAPYAKLGPLLQWSSFNVTQEGFDGSGSSSLTETDFKTALALGIAG